MPFLPPIPVRPGSEPQDVPWIGKALQVIHDNIPLTQDQLDNPEVAAKLALTSLYQFILGEFLPRDEFTKIYFRGAQLGIAKDKASQIKNYDLAEFITDVSLSLSNQQISQMTFTVEDPGLKFYNQELFAVGGEVTYHSIPFVINACALSGGSSGLGGVVVTVRPKLVQALKNQHDAFSMSNVTAAEYVVMECKAVGMMCVAEQGPKRTTIIREQIVEGQVYSDDEMPSAWTTIEKLAQEEGYMLFECYGVLFFCKPSWLYTQAVTNANQNLTTVGFYWNDSKSALTKSNAGGEGILNATLEILNLGMHVEGAVIWQQCLEVPNISVAYDQAPGPAWTVTLTVPLEASNRYYVGMRAQIRGVGAFNETAALLITDIAFSMAGTGTCQITLKTPYDPKPINDTSTNNRSGNGHGVFSSLFPAQDAGINLLPGKYGGTYLDNVQLNNAAAIYQATIKRKLTRTEAVIALTTAYTESTLHRYWNLAVSGSENVKPNDGPPPSGGDHDSIGLFQQRGPWGSVKDRMDATTSTNLFLSRLLQLPSRAGLTIGEICQSVQVSAFPERYEKNVPIARALVQAIIASQSSPSNLDGWRPGHPIGTKLNTDFVHIGLQMIGKKYVYGGGRGNPNDVQSSYDCSSLIQWSAYQVGVKYPTDTRTQLPWCQTHGTMISVEEALNTYGAVFFKSDNSHTGISLGDGKRTLEAYDVGIGVIVNSPTKYGYSWGYGARIPGMLYQK